ncbi:MAG: HEAT repeat domain-containing protein [Lunatimonas sp.]|uniref:PVC-type heme-binding CxxCH protein n=1 Tax=Lunatimonas sp. TaxID=2060141 RepID=UPI00263B2235|nr:PVC-type heme-binding CxxCH protein [Lunatimonas sp.]MCC5939347.1 HEAT repeat domain-containing protein [Lunatimonas sp.]
MNFRGYGNRLIAGGVLGILLLAVYLFLTVVSDDSAPDGEEAYTLTEGFEVTEAVLPGLLSYPMFASFDDSGNLFVFESSGHTDGTQEILDRPDFRILLLRDLDGDGVFDHRTVYADSLPFPMGGTFFQGSLYVTAVPDLLKFTDTDGDGVAEEKEVLLSGWKLNHNAAILSGPFMGPDGWLYMADARRGFEITTDEGKQLSGKGARIWRCLPDGSRLESFSGGGFDNAVELAFTPSGEVFGTMTYFVDPQGGYRDALMHWVEGGVFPKPNPVIEEDGLVLTGDLMPVMSKMARVSPSGLMRYEGDFWGEGFEGNLFHAQFNTGRIVRSVVAETGASFASNDTYFLESKAADFHPTDVLQDADGSLLVVNTGGWFIAGCPLSRTAKPDIHGGIFRIRKKGTQPVSDPYGNEQAWDQLATPSLVEALSVPGPFVRKRAQEAILQQGIAAAPHLLAQLTTHSDAEVRTQLVFLLYRLGVLEGLEVAAKDPSASVRSAYARVAGLAPWTPAQATLVGLLEDASLSVVRQAATALGRLGREGVSAALLSVLERSEDRYVRHAVIFSLWQLGKVPVLREALRHAQAGVRTGALIALEQVPQAALTQPELLAFLESEAEEDRKAGRWVLGRHADWSALALPLFRQATSDGLAELQVLFRIFSGQEVFQRGFEQVLTGSKEDEMRQRYLELLQGASVRPFPERWKPILGQWMQTGSPALRSRTLDFVLIGSLTGMEGYLLDMADPKSPLSLRVRALQALAREGYRPPAEELRDLMDGLLQEAEGKEMTQAIQLLGSLELDEASLLYLSDAILPRLEDRYVPYMLPMFEGQVSKQLGGSLLAFLVSKPTLMDKLSEDQVAQLFSGDLPGLGDQVAGLLSQIRRQREERLARLHDLEERLIPGDVLAGRNVFYGEAGCGDCHAVSGEGAVFGPDLSNIGEIRSRHDLLEAVVYPSASFAREYESVEVRTASGAWLGIIKGRDAGELVLEIGPGVFRRISEESILEIRESEQSLMPAGWEELLTVGQISDLMAFLESLPDGIGAVR